MILTSQDNFEADAENGKEMERCFFWRAGGSSHPPGTEPKSPTLQADSLPNEPQGRPGGFPGYVNSS